MADAPVRLVFGWRVRDTQWCLDGGSGRLNGACVSMHDTPYEGSHESRHTTNPMCEYVRQSLCVVPCDALERAPPHGSVHRTLYLACATLYIACGRLYMACGRVDSTSGVLHCTWALLDIALVTSIEIETL